MKQFSQTKLAQAFTPKVNPFEAAHHGELVPPHKESLYEKILLNRDLDPTFFEDLPSENDEDGKEMASVESGEDSGSEELGISFKFNADHCLHVFNVLKNGGVTNGANYFEMNRNVTASQGAYVYLNAQARAEYLRSLALIDLQIDGLFKQREKQGKGTKRGASSHEDSSHSSETAVLQPPNSLHEIFAISNNNRKRNKQRKKSKLESC